MPSDQPVPGLLAVRPREAAQMLGLSERALWTLTKRGDVPIVRVGRAVLIPVDGLRAFLAKSVEGNAK